MNVIIKYIEKIGHNISTSTNGIECYIFGSMLHNISIANDVDILIIYNHENQLDIIKQEFKLLESIYPMHMNYFTYIEESELNFIKNVNAELIFKV